MPTLSPDQNEDVGHRPQHDYKQHATVRHWACCNTSGGRWGDCMLKTARARLWATIAVDAVPVVAPATAVDRARLSCNRRGSRKSQQHNTTNTDTFSIKYQTGPRNAARKPKWPQTWARTTSECTPWHASFRQHITKTNASMNPLPHLAQPPLHANAKRGLRGPRGQIEPGTNNAFAVSCPAANLPASANLGSLGSTGSIGVNWGQLEPTGVKWGLFGSIGVNWGQSG